jgi:hypothetical protein
MLINTETQFIRRKMQLGKNTINFLIILAIVVAGIGLSLFYLYALDSINTMQKNPKVIEIDSLRKKHLSKKLY